MVLAQEASDRGPDKAEAALTVAPARVARVDWRGRVLTGDALCCQRALCRQVTRAGGDALVLVREHQPTLHHDRALLVDPPADLRAPLPLLDRREARTIEKGHGRTHDRRHLVASTDLTGDRDWPGLAQVFRPERTWREGGTWHRHLHYGSTGPPPADADAARLLALKRGHRRIEDRLIRGGNRRLNAILYRIAPTRLRHSAQAQAYRARRVAEGKTRREAGRALKRFIARAIWRQGQICQGARAQPAQAVVA